MSISFKAASRSITVVASLLCLGGVLSFTKSDSRFKPLALNIILTSAAIAITNEATTKFNEDSANSQLKEFTNNHTQQLKTLTTERDDISNKFINQISALDEVRALVGKRENDIKARDGAIQLLQNKLDFLTQEFNQKTSELDRKLNTEDTRIDEFIALFKNKIITDLNAKLHHVANSLSDSIAFQIDKIEREDTGKESEKLEKFTALYRSIDDYYQNHKAMLTEILDLSGEVNLIVSEVTRIYFRITEELAALKVRFRNLLNVDERLALENAYDVLADYSKTHTPIVKAKDLLNEYSDFQKTQLNSLGGQLEENVNSLEEMRGQVFDLINQLETLALEKADLNEKIKALSKPQQFYGTSSAAKAGNKISDYYYKSGIKLDCLDWEETQAGYFITFGIRHNPGLTEKDILGENRQEQLAAFTNALHGTLPTVELNYQKCTVKINVTLRQLTKQEKDELSDESINRLARSWETWKKQAKKWNRIRITGGSGAGKSPLTERIVSEQLQHKKVKAIDSVKLYNPQAGSRKDNWSFPSTGKTHQDSVRGIAELTALCGRKYQGAFGIWIFDEVDSTLRQAPGKKRATADDPEPEPTMSANMLSIITQIDHTSQAVFYLGQGANTGKIPNTTKGDWNNLVAIHINGNAKDYLRLADHIDSESKDKLMKQADLLQRYCDRKNSELGLDRVEPGAYRFALIDEYGEKQYYVLLPLFSADEFLDSLVTPQVEIDTPVIVKPEVQIQCPHCGSEKFKKHRAVADADKYRYLCLNLECKKTFIAELLTNSN